MMRKLFTLFLVLGMMINKAYAYEFAVENEDGVKIYYNYCNDGKELEVTYDSSTRTHYSGKVVIPDEVTYMDRTRKVTSIGPMAFYGCFEMTSVSIPNTVTLIGNNAFNQCHGLTSITIPSNVVKIDDYAFYYCSEIKTFDIPNSVTYIGESAFRLCKGLKTITIPSSVTHIGYGAFSEIDLSIVISKVENPFVIAGNESDITRTFSQNTFYNATLYVPAGTIDKYKATEGWKDFAFIEEGTGSGGEDQKCATPTINYQNGKLTFNCETEGASCQYTITDDDIKSGNSNEVQLGVTYNISVYATKDGYSDSDVATATLCWIDMEPRSEGLSNLAQVRAKAVMIQSSYGAINISGVDDGEIVEVYSLSGQMIASSKASRNQATIYTNLRKGEIVIIRIGDKSVKIKTN